MRRLLAALMFCLTLLVPVALPVAPQPATQPQTDPETAQRRVALSRDFIQMAPASVSSYDVRGQIPVLPPPVLPTPSGSSNCAPGPSFDSLSQGLRNGQTPSERQPHPMQPSS
jgi:hypothetical protein